jgi:hypothetical protein
MAYNAVAQLDDLNDAASQSSDSDASHAPGSLEPPEPVVAVAPLASLINRTLSRDYEMVEDDDYEEYAGDDPSPATITAPSQSLAIVTPNDAPATGAPIVDAVSHPDTTATTTTTENGLPLSASLVRTPSVSSVDLRHPTPDLQSLQGAYVGNIERLEKSAERLSMTSSDLGVELRKLDMEQKRRESTSSIQQGPESPSRQFSSTSVSNSIIGLNSTARSGGYSPAAFLTSPRGSILSGSRLRSTSLSSPLQDIHEPKPNEDAVQTHEDQDKNIHLSYELPKPELLPEDETERRELRLVEPTDGIPERPLTARSTDTYQQATDLFLDFDGVHFVPHPRDPSLSHQPPVRKSKRASTAKHFDKPQAGQDMIFYPAPIPKILNLPQKLSKRPQISDHEKRRTQLLNVALETDKNDDHTMDNPAGKRKSEIPAQLRASAFFDRPVVPLDIKIKNKSAVDTLESILDASARAPVTAFVDHPIVGSAGREVYSAVEKKRSSRMLGEKKDRRSRSTLQPHDGPASQSSLGPVHSDVEEHEGSALHGEDSDSGRSRSHSSDVSTSDSSSDEGESADELDREEEEEYDESKYTGRPTTLLAELQMRKHELKQRNRTAATAFPNGLHSTLLQLDAVAQAQSQQRRQKRVTLAWDTQATNEADEADDEDIPLAMLYASKNPALEERPLGLMERRDMEENEPLSKRRARLRGEVPEGPPNKRSSTMLRVPAAESDSENEGETLAQRIRRLKAEKLDKSKNIISAEFESEIMTELGKLHEPVDPVEPAPKKTQTPSKPREPAVEEEETLGQRRKRLQAEARIRKTQSTADMNARRSMADILQTYPRQHAYGASVDYTQNARASWNPGAAYQHNRVSTMYTLPPSMMYQAGFGQVPGHDLQAAHGNHAYNTSFMPNAQMGMNVGFAPGLPPLQGAAQRNPTDADPRQRDVIDRWRQSVTGL